MNENSEWLSSLILTSQCALSQNSHTTQMLRNCILKQLLWNSVPHLIGTKQAKNTPREKARNNIINSGEVSPAPKMPGQGGHRLCLDSPLTGGVKEEKEVSPGGRCGWNDPAFSGRLSHTLPVASPRKDNGGFTLFF